MLQIARDKGDKPSKHVYVIGEDLEKLSETGGKERSEVYWVAGIGENKYLEISPGNHQVRGLLKPGEGPVKLVLTLKGESR